MTCVQCGEPIVTGEEFEAHIIERCSGPGVTVHVHKKCPGPVIK